MRLRDRLRQIFGETDRIELQNRLGRISVRDLALTLIYLEDDERDLFYNLLPQKKIIQLNQELLYARRLALSYAKCARIIRYTLTVLDGSADVKRIHSWIKPGG